TPLKMIRQQYKKKLADNITVTSRDIVYSDFREFLELALFGFLVESTSSTNNYMQTDRVIAYPSIETKFGHIINCQSSLEQFKQYNFQCILGEEYESKFKPSIKGIRLPIPQDAFTS